MNATIRWTEEEMIEAARDYWDRDDCRIEDCEVIRATDGDDEPCLVVLHTPTGRTTDEARNQGRWHLDGTAYTD